MKIKKMYGIYAIMSCIGLLYFKDSITTGIARVSTGKAAFNQCLHQVSTYTIERSKSKLIKSTSERLDFSSLSRYIHFNVKDDNTKCDKRRYIVYTCSTVCGGWGDRLKGITSLFLLAQLTNRTLLIDMHTPCELGNFVTPNIYDWKTCLPFIKQGNNINSIQLSYMDMDNFKLLNLNDFVSGKFKKYHIIRIKTNIHVVAHFMIRKHPLANLTMPWLQTFSTAEVTGSIIGLLFKPTYTLLKEINSFHNDKVGKKFLVCSHIRYGNNPSNPKDAIFGDRDARVSSILQFMKRYDNANTAIFIATDSNSVRNKSRSLLTNYVSTEQPIVHIDRTHLGKDATCYGFKAVILENVLLSTCDVLVLTPSGYGTMAAYMRGHSENIFMYLCEGKGIFNVTLSGIHENYKYLN